MVIGVTIHFLAIDIEFEGILQWQNQMIWLHQAIHGPEDIKVVEWNRFSFHLCVYFHDCWKLTSVRERNSDSTVLVYCIYNICNIPYSGLLGLERHEWMLS